MGHPNPYSHLNIYKPSSTFLNLSAQNRRRDVVFCLGRGKNFAFLEYLNKKHDFFEKIIPLDHPRYIMQYKSKAIGEFILFYLNAFKPYTQL